MKIEKLHNNSWRIRKMYQRKTYTIILDHKPTQKEAIELMAEKLKNAEPINCGFTFSKALEEYITLRENVVSPTTIRGYRSTVRSLPEWFRNKRVSQIDANDVQLCISEFTKDHSPKSVRNAHGIISAVLGTFNKGLVLSTTLPQKSKEEPYCPTDEDVKRILAEAKGKIKVGLTLAVFGLRRSEICALTPADIDGNIVHINKAMVQNDDKEWVIKQTKNTSSTRDIYIPDSVVNMIAEFGLYDGHPNSMYTWLMRTQKRLGMPQFGVHMLRHYYASMAHAMGIPDKYIQANCGWSSPYTMHKIYIQSQKDKEKEMQEKAADKLKGLIF